MPRQYVQYTRKAQAPRFELTPLIDVVFILVIFFAVTTSFSPPQQGLTLMLPSAVSVETSDQSVSISIDKHQRVYWDGVRISESDISPRVAMLMEESPLHRVILQADKHTAYVRIVSVLDAIRQAGCSRVMLQAEKI